MRGTGGGDREDADGDGHDSCDGPRKFQFEETASRQAWNAISTTPLVGAGSPNGEPGVPNENSLGGAGGSHDSLS